MVEGSIQGHRFQRKLTLDQSIIARYEWLNIEERDNDYAANALRYAIDSYTHSHWAESAAGLNGIIDGKSMHNSP